VLGVVPWLPGIRLDAEDALPIEAYAGSASDAAGGGGARLRVAVVRFPRVSNFTDVDALAIEPGVDVEFTASAGAVEAADLVVLPGTKSTVADLRWLRERGLEGALARRAAEGRPILGICGGYQMLGTVIEDPDGVEAAPGSVAGLGLLPVRTRFVREKTLTRPSGFGLGEPVHGYEIHCGQVTVDGGSALFTSADGSAQDGCRAGAVWGTIWHGALEGDSFRRAFLTEIAAAAGVAFTPDPGTSFAAERERQLDALGDAVEAYVDTDAVWRLIEEGPTPGLPGLWPGAA
jgi:adenosylcobyric acid synthase